MLPVGYATTESRAFRWQIMGRICSAYGTFGRQSTYYASISNFLGFKSLYLYKKTIETDELPNVASLGAPCRQVIGIEKFDPHSCYSVIDMFVGSDDDVPGAGQRETLIPCTNHNLTSRPLSD